MKYMPWMSEKGNERAIQLRELRMPADCRMDGNMRALRDAMLAYMLLSEHLSPMDANPYVSLERLRLRSNQRAEMMRKRELLESVASPETIEKCHVAAARLLGLEIEEQRAKRARSFVPNLDRTISDRAYREYWSRVKREREGKHNV